MNHDMDISRTRQARNILGWITSLLLFAAIACLADALREGFMDGGSEYKAVPGETVSFTSPLPPGAGSLEEMKITGGDADVALKPEGLYTGFWLGGTMWKGSIAVTGGAASGERVFTLEGPPLEHSGKGPAGIVIRVTVYKDALAKQKASASMITRVFGVRPYMVSLAALGLAIIPGVAGFAASRRVERLLTLDGKGVVYMMKRTGDDAVIGFSLGSRQGLAPGMTVPLFDRQGRGIGFARVTESLPSDATAVMVSGSCEIGDMVVLTSEGAPGRHTGAQPQHR
ncbi:MAG: hypothetical protein ACOZEN_03725 [Thermodesulfobacteriota bacterium]